MATTVANVSGISSDAKENFAILQNRGDSDDEEPWEEEDWIPRMSNGKQKSPAVIRSELARYMDKSSRTKKSIMEEMGVSANLMSKFMNPKYYKDPWAAVQYNTYWAAARFLEKVKTNKQKQSSGRKRAGAPADPQVKQKAKARKTEVDQLFATLAEMDHDTGPIYDSCQQVIKKIKAFLLRDGVTKAAFCRALGGLNANSLNRFLLSKKDDQRTNVTYVRAYRFFELLRIHEGQAKSAARLKNEAEQGSEGFTTERHPTRALLLLDELREFRRSGLLG